MKAWMKGAIVGAVWGLISVGLWIASMGGPLPSIWDKIVLFPGYFTYTLVGVVKWKVSYIPSSKIVWGIIWIVSPTLVGISVGILITDIIRLIRGKTK